MSLDEYNRHATLGKMAGPATSAAAAAGQAAWERNHAQPQASGAAAPPPSLRASLGILAFFAVVCGLSAAAAYYLPEESTLATIAAGAAALSALAFVIMALLLSVQVAAAAAGFVVVVGLRYLGWAALVALLAFVFAEFHAFAFEPYPTWIAPLVLGALAALGQAVRALRAAAIALGSGAIGYILIASHVFDRHSFTALALAGAITLIVFIGARALHARRA